MKIRQARKIMKGPFRGMVYRESTYNKAVKVALKRFLKRYRQVRQAAISSSTES